MTPWATPEQIRAIWADAPASPRLDDLAEVAQEVLEAYAPASTVTAIAAGGDVPARYREALALHCRDVWGAANRDSDFLVGDADFAVRVRAVSDAVRALLRPRNPVPRFGRRTPPAAPEVAV